MHVFNYALCKFVPYGIVVGLLAYCLGLFATESWILFGLIWYIDHFSFKTGYAVAYCEANDIDLSDE